MIETTTFDVARCSDCAADVVAAWDLIGDEMQRVCPHCETVLADESSFRALTGSSLRRLGYAIEGEGPKASSCSSGGCGSCSRA